MVRWTVWG